VAIDAANFIIFISKNGKRSLKITILVCVFTFPKKKAAKLPNFGAQKKTLSGWHPLEKSVNISKKKHCRNVAIENRKKPYC
jgi:hypothetical protein